MAALISSLPAPLYTPHLEEDDEPSTPPPSTSTALITPSRIPPYGQRRSWRPTSQDDFADGGAFPECPIAQYPLEMGRKAKTTSGNTLALQVDADGKVRFNAIGWSLCSKPSSKGI